MTSQRISVVSWGYSSVLEYYFKRFGVNVFPPCKSVIILVVIPSLGIISNIILNMYVENLNKSYFMRITKIF